MDHTLFPAEDVVQSGLPVSLFCLSWEINYQLKAENYVDEVTYKVIVKKSILPEHTLRQEGAHEVCQTEKNAV